MNLYNKKENITSESGKTISDEALQNIASVYNNKNLTVSNLTVTAWKGIICAWSGAITDIPQGWGFCDGTKYKALDGSDLQSPDLRSKFILGASSSATTYNDCKLVYKDSRTQIPFCVGMFTVNETGGEEQHRLTIAEIPSHTHNYVTTVWSPEYAAGGGSGHFAWFEKVSTTDGGNVGNGPSTPNTAHNNMPPYYALAYIIKL